MRKILVINGPNLNLLGNRDTSLYGKLTLLQINKLMSIKASKMGISLNFKQSNHEGILIDFIQKNAKSSIGIIINPGALTHYGYSLRDALIDSNLPIAEVHLSEISKREDFRKIDVLEGIVIAKFSGLLEKGYLKALEILYKTIKL